MSSKPEYILTPAHQFDPSKMVNPPAHYRDLLKEVYEKKITEEEAQAIWRNVEGSDYNEQMGFIELKERIAVRSLPFEILAKWRY